jgi:hypothetical protein
MTQRAGIAVTLQIRIREVIIRISAGAPATPIEVLVLIFNPSRQLTVQSSDWTMTASLKSPFEFNIHISSHHSTLGNIATDCVVKKFTHTKTQERAYDVCPTR